MSRIFERVHRLQESLFPTLNVYELEEVYAPCLDSVWRRFVDETVKFIADGGGVGAQSTTGKWFIRDNDWIPVPDMDKASDIDTWWSNFVDWRERSIIAARKRSNEIGHSIVDSTGSPLIVVINSLYRKLGVLAMAMEPSSKWHVQVVAGLICITHLKSLLGQDHVIFDNMEGVTLVVNEKFYKGMEDLHTDPDAEFPDITGRLTSVGVTFDNATLKLLALTSAPFTLPKGFDFPGSPAFKQDKTRCSAFKQEMATSDVVILARSGESDFECVRYVYDMPSGISEYSMYEHALCTSSSYTYTSQCIPEMQKYCTEHFNEYFSQTICSDWISKYRDAPRLPNDVIPNVEGLKTISSLCKKDMTRPMCATMCRQANLAGFPHFCEDSFTAYCGKNPKSRECVKALRCRNEYPKAPVAANKECWWSPCLESEYHFLSHEVQQRMHRCKYRMTFLGVDNLKLSNGARLRVRNATNLGEDYSSQPVNDSPQVSFPMPDFRILIVISIAITMGLLIRKSYIEHLDIQNTLTRVHEGHVVSNPVMDP